MARLPRLTLPGYVHYLTQRGNNGQPIAVSDVDCERLHALLVEHSRRLHVAVHAYVLLADAFQLLATPRDALGVPQLMQAVGRSYVRQFNLSHGRRGTLWEGRYRSTLIQPERYLLDCMAHLELAPVAAGLVQSPEDYRWSSHRHQAGRAVDKLVTPHPLFWSLGDTPFSRELAYRDRVHAGLPAMVQEQIHRASLNGWPLGDERFLVSVHQESGRRVSPARPGRPRSA